MAETFTDQAGLTRVKDTEIVVPIVCGSASFHLGKKATDGVAFRWTVYVRHADNEDLSHILSKVVFTLHESFATPVREIAEAPYELTEQGWGEFEILIALHFKEDSHEGPVEIVHKLKLYADEAGGTISKKPVVHEQYDELVFSEPEASFFQRVSNQVAVPAHPYTVAPQFTLMNPDLEVETYESIRTKIAETKRKSKRQLELTI